MVAANGEWVSGEVVNASDLNSTSDVGNDGDTINGPNWIVTSFDANRRGPLLMIYIIAERNSGVSLGPVASGNIPNEIVCTLPATCRGPEPRLQPLSSIWAGAQISGYYDPVTGEVWISAIPANFTINDDYQISLGGLVIVD